MSPDATIQPFAASSSIDSKTIFNSHANKQYSIAFDVSVDDTQVSSIASSLSTRQLLRIARRLANYPAEDLEHSVHKACLARYGSKSVKSSCSYQ